MGTARRNRGEGGRGAVLQDPMRVITCSNSAHSSEPKDSVAPRAPRHCGKEAPVARELRGGLGGEGRAFQAEGKTGPRLVPVSGPAQTEDSRDHSLAKIGVVRDTKGKAERERPPRKWPEGLLPREGFPAPQEEAPDILDDVLGGSLYKENNSILLGPSESEMVRSRCRQVLIPDCNHS